MRKLRLLLTVILGGYMNMTHFSGVALSVGLLHRSGQVPSELSGLSNKIVRLR